MSQMNTDIEPSHRASGRVCAYLEELWSEFLIPKL